MSHSTADRAPAHGAQKDEGRGAWIGLGILFLGCAAFTVAIVSLASDKSVSAICGIIGAPLFIIGLTLMIIGERRQ